MLEYTPTCSNLVILHTYSPTMTEQTECSELLAYKIRMPGNYPEGSICHSEHSKGLTSRINEFVFVLNTFGDCGSAVDKALRYKSGGRWFDSRWCHWNFSLT